MSYGYKAKTNASQVAIRDWYSTNDAVLLMVARSKLVPASTMILMVPHGASVPMVFRNLVI